MGKSQVHLIGEPALSFLLLLGLDKCDEIVTGIKAGFSSAIMGQSGKLSAARRRSFLAPRLVHVPLSFGCRHGDSSGLWTRQTS
ncbi:hypothetical protein P280DRAFT_466972 [Massarina eburnea CBS 473.64]|uniref:Uncharacterized protein n=1 Tax=Massarina eburnea CBS 473.64 TaxID=1395130 RepID=A0A6A6S9S2_9PLEO|nr:hypothetical protein P280DRAFT_466972 [Massarina eburnea CBS 473.64]